MADEDIASKFEEYRAQASSRCVAAGCGALESCMGSSVCPSVAPAPVIGVVPTQYPSEKSVVMANRYKRNNFKYQRDTDIKIMPSTLMM